MIRVRVPLDLHTITRTGSGAFALATPIRVRDVIALAVREAIGLRAPHDKLVRSVRGTLAGFASGRFTVDIDGRTFQRVDEIVLCGDVISVRFFIPSKSLPMHRSELAAPER